MKRRVLSPRPRTGLELQQALNDWIDASRRACEPTHDPGDEQAEHAAWRRVQSVLAVADTATAA